MEPSLDDVYRKFAEVAEAAQLLETELGNLLLMIHGTESKLYLFENREQAVEICRSINRSTLGQLLRRFARKTDAEAVVRLFDKALAERNRLSHSFYRQHNYRRNSVEGRKIMLNDLASMHDTIFRAYKIALALGSDDVNALPEHLPTEHLNLD